MLIKGSRWFARQAICLSSLLLASQAGAVRQGSLGPSSAGSIGISISVASRARISQPKDIRLDALGISISSVPQHLCLSSNTMAHSFKVSAAGSGNGGALVLSNGHRNIRFHLEFAPQQDTALGQGGGTQDSLQRGCDHGQRAIAFVVAIDPEHIDEIQASPAFTGSLTLIVAPN